MSGMEEKLTQLMTYVEDNSEVMGSEIYRQIADSLVDLKKEDTHLKLYKIKYITNLIAGTPCTACECDNIDFNVDGEEHQHIVRVVPYEDDDETSFFEDIHHLGQIHLRKDGSLPDFEKIKQCFHHKGSSLRIITILSFEEYK